MAKPVGPVCNLECSYCYYLGTAGFYVRPHQFRMPDDLLETYVRQYIEASPGPIVHFVWPLARRGPKRPLHLRQRAQGEAVLLVGAAVGPEPASCARG